MLRAIALALAFAQLACSGPAAPQHTRRPIAFQLPAVDGGTISLSRYRGKPVLIHVFTTWDTAATADVDQLTELHRRRMDDVTIIGVALDPDGHKLIAPWRRALSVPYLIAVATDAVRRGNSPLGPLAQVPTTIVLRADGSIAARIERPLALGEAEALIERHP